MEGVVRVMRKAPERRQGDDGLPVAPYALYNIGNSHPENLLDFVRILEEELVGAGVLPEDYDFDAHKELVPMQPGDVPVTYADTSALERDFGFRPSTPSSRRSPPLRPMVQGLLRHRLKNNHAYSDNGSRLGIGGAERVASSWANGLSRRGHEVFIRTDICSVKQSYPTDKGVKLFRTEFIVIKSLTSFTRFVEKFSSLHLPLMN